MLLRRLDRWLTCLERGLYLGAAVTLALMMLSISADALGRYLFWRPISGVFEINEMYLLTAVVYLSIARAQHLDGHIAVRSLHDRLAPSLRWIIRVVGRLLAACLFAAISLKSGQMTISQFVMGNMTSGAVELPSWIGWSFVWIGSTVMTLRLLLQVAIDVFGHGNACDSIAPEPDGAHDS